MIPSFDAIKAIGHQRGESIVLSTMSPHRYWRAISDKPDLDLPIFGGMGKASSVGLGLALARPDKKVMVLEGDGGLLMNLGTLVTIAGQEPANLLHFVFEDGVYFTTGGQPVPGAGKFDLAAMARDAGISESHGFDNLEDFVSELPDIMRKRGPVFVSLKVDHSADMPELRTANTGASMRGLAAKLQEGS